MFRAGLERGGEDSEVPRAAGVGETGLGRKHGENPSATAYIEHHLRRGAQWECYKVPRQVSGGWQVEGIDPP